MLHYFPVNSHTTYGSCKTESELLIYTIWLAKSMITDLKSYFLDSVSPYQKENLYLLRKNCFCQKDNFTLKDICFWLHLFMYLPFYYFKNWIRILFKSVYTHSRLPFHNWNKKLWKLNHIWQVVQWIFKLLRVGFWSPIFLVWMGESNVIL